MGLLVDCGAFGGFLKVRILDFVGGGVVFVLFSYLTHFLAYALMGVFSHRQVFGRRGSFSAFCCVFLAFCGAYSRFGGIYFLFALCPR